MSRIIGQITESVHDLSNSAAKPALGLFRRFSISAMTSFPFVEHWVMSVSLFVSAADRVVTTSENDPTVPDTTQVRSASDHSPSEYSPRETDLKQFACAAPPKARMNPVSSDITFIFMFAFSRFFLPGKHIRTGADVAIVFLIMFITPVIKPLRFAGVEQTAQCFRGSSAS